MDIALVIAAGGLLLLAIAHSALGEMDVIRPLVAADWSIDELPRGAADRLLRIAWHLTSVAWLGLAAVAAGASPLTAVGAAGIASAVLMFLSLRAHFAWPLFLLSGLAALWADGVVASSALRVTAWLTVAVLAGLGCLHVYWAVGGRYGIEAALPSGPDGTPTFTPGPFLTLLVAVLLWGFAAIVAARASGVGHWTVAAAVAVGVAAMVIRAIGDGRQVGFSKSDRSTVFARADDAAFTPLVVLLAFGGASALLL